MTRRLKDSAAAMLIVDLMRALLRRQISSSTQTPRATSVRRESIRIFIAATGATLLACASAMAAEDHTLGERITVPPVEQLTPEQRQRQEEVTAALRSDVGASLPPGTTGPRGLLVLHPKLFDAWGVFSGVASGGTTFEPRLKELAIITTARALDSPYEWYAHEDLALRRGVSIAVVDAIRKGKKPKFDKADERIVYNYTHELHAQHRVSDATYKQAWDLLGTQQLLELTVLIGHYSNVAITSNAHRLALPPGGKNTLPLPKDQP